MNIYFEIIISIQEKKFFFGKFLFKKKDIYILFISTTSQHTAHHNNTRAS